MNSLHLPHLGYAFRNMIGAAPWRHDLPLARGLARAIGVLALFALLCHSLAAAAQVAAAARIDFVFFSSPDCPYCRRWEAVDLQQLEKSRLFKQIRFTKVTKAIGSTVPDVSSFPDEIKRLREPIAEKIKGAGSPMFAILADGQVVAGWRGSKKYSPDQILEIIGQQRAQLPATKSVLGRSGHAAPLALTTAAVAH